LKFIEHILYFLVNHIEHLLHEFLNDFFHDFLFEGFFLWVSLGSLVTFIIVLLVSGAGNPVFSFSTKSSIELIFLRSVVSFLSSSPHCSTWCCATMFLIGWCF
jgi:hypothetical protein